MFYIVKGTGHRECCLLLAETVYSTAAARALFCLRAHTFLEKEESIMDAHPQATTHQSSRSPASMPPTQPGRRSRRGRLPRPKSWSNTIYLLLLIAVVAIELYPVLVSLYNAVTNGSELYWLFF